MKNFSPKYNIIQIQKEKEILTLSIATKGAGSIMPLLLTKPSVVSTFHCEKALTFLQ